MRKAIENGCDTQVRGCLPFIDALKNGGAPIDIMEKIMNRDEILSSYTEEEMSELAYDLLENGQVELVVLLRGLYGYLMPRGYPVYWLYLKMYASNLNLCHFAGLFPDEYDGKKILMEVLCLWLVETPQDQEGVRKIVHFICSRMHHYKWSFLTIEGIGQYDIHLRYRPAKQIHDKSGFVNAPDKLLSGKEVGILLDILIKDDAFMCRNICLCCGIPSNAEKRALVAKTVEFKSKVCNPQSLRSLCIASVANSIQGNSTENLQSLHCPHTVIDDLKHFMLKGYLRPEQEKVTELVDDVVEKLFDESN